ncbi:MAG: PilZ domain-containing protein [Acidobacteriota bacterium]
MKNSFHKIGRKFGRRAHERFSIPGANITWTPKGQETFPKETTPLSDISRNGVSFLTNNTPDEAEEIAIRINLPKQPGRLELLGITVYSIYRGPGLTYEYRVGVKLKPFSAAEGNNSIESKKAIEKLEETYGKHLETQDIDD